MKHLDSPKYLDPELLAAVARYSAVGIAPNTVRAYRSGWRCFERWCAAHRLGALPASPLTIATYLANRAGSLKSSSLALHVAAIRQAHLSEGFDSPTRGPEVSAVLRGIRRHHGAGTTKKLALTVPELGAVVAVIEDDLRGRRDRALLLLGFSGGFRRSELVGLDVSDLFFRDEGVVVSLRRTKTDQEQRGRLVAIAHGLRPETCPVQALDRWVTAAGAAAGPLFRAIDRHGAIGRRRLNGRAVARVVQARGRAAGLDPVLLGGHSLRSGLVTAAAKARIEERDIAGTTGHKNLTVLRGYIQQADPFAAALTRRIGF